jgi:hypothetical protein
MVISLRRLYVMNFQLCNSLTVQATKVKTMYQVSGLALLNFLAYKGFSTPVNTGGFLLVGKEAMK